MLSGRKVFVKYLYIPLHKDLRLVYLHSIILVQYNKLTWSSMMGSETPEDNECMYIVYTGDLWSFSWEKYTKILC